MSMMRDLNNLGQSIWYSYIRRFCISRVDTAVDTVNTLLPATLAAFRDSGSVYP